MFGHCFHQLYHKPLLNQSCLLKDIIRKAYKEEWTPPPEIQGQQCVVKEVRDSSVWGSTDLDTTIRIYGVLAREFNRSVVPSYPISFTNNVVHKVTKQANSYELPECVVVVVEDHIKGNHIKWCNKYGYMKITLKETILNGVTSMDIYHQMLKLFYK